MDRQGAAESQVLKSHGTQNALGGGAGGAALGGGGRGGTTGLGPERCAGGEGK